MKTLAALFFVVAAPLAAAAQDKIVWKGERAPTEGSVVNITFTQIKYRLANAGSEQEDNARDVKDIVFDTDNTIIPYEYSHGLNALHKGAFKEAVDQFRTAIGLIRKSNSPNHPVRDFCWKYIIEAQRSLGEPQSVINSCRELRKEKPDTFFLRESFLAQYEAAKSMRNAKELDSTLKDLDEVIRSDRRYADLQRDADLLRADVLEAGKRYADALAVYSRLGGDRELSEEVSLGTLRCLSALNRTADLKTKVESLLTEIKEKRETSPRVYIGAIVGRGDVHLAEGRIKDALLDYMKGAIDPGQGSNTYEHETAVAKAAIAAAKYAKQFGDKDKQNKAVYADRAKEMQAELLRAYPQSSWATEVDAAIKDALRN